MATAAVEAAHQPLSYFASQLDVDKPHWFETPEGFRIYRDVPIARTGVQQYTGHELKKHRDYEPSWNLDENSLYDVHRDPREVLSPETIASFEGKSFTDGHPPGSDLWLHTYSDGKYSRGHVQNVRKGGTTDEGENPLVADVHVKDSDLNGKIDDGQREVSAGYTYRLVKDAAGRLAMKDIRGNHVASVPRGRAGRDIAIVDAAPPELLQAAVPTTKKEKGKRMANQKWSLGRLLHLVATAEDAEPEDVERVSNLLAERDAEKQLDQPKIIKKDGTIADEDTPMWAKELMARLPKEPIERAAEKKVAADEAATGSVFEGSEMNMREMLASINARLDKLESEEDDDEDEDDEDEDSGAEGDRKRGVRGDDAEELKDKDKPESILPLDEPLDDAVGDSAVFMKAIRPLIAKSKDTKLQAGYRKLVRSQRQKATSTGDASVDPILFLSSPGQALERDAEVNPNSFFRGKTHAEGLKAYEAHMASKGAK